jgi:putative peptidoglycan lipid II flippase
VSSSTQSKSATPAGAGSARSAVMVACGIFLSRIAGLVRDRIFAHFFGNSDAADAFKAAFRIPNFLQNLFGEGVLSASFIPVYAHLLSEKKDKEAGQVAGAVAAILALVVSLLVLIGVLLTPWLISLIAPGFVGGKRELTIRLVRIIFPGAGLLVLSAWCLGVLNSHRRFFLSYSAPIIWNVALIVSLLIFGPKVAQEPLTVIYAWASVLGTGLQILVQLPTVLRLAKYLRLSLNYRMQHVKTVLRNFVPVFFGRGVTQISAFIDGSIASLLPTGALSALGYTQTLYLLPLSLFGMSVSAAELPSMSSALGDRRQVAGFLAVRLNAGLRRIAFFIVPSAIAFLVIGDVIVAAIYQTGRFTHSDVIYVWIILAGYGVGLPAATLGRLYSSAYYALRDTATPFRFALIRVSISALLSVLLALWLPGRVGLDSRWGVVGLSLGAGLAGWLEFFLLRRKMNAVIGVTGLSFIHSLRLLSASLIAAAAAFALKTAVSAWHPIATAILTLSGFGLCYLLLAFVMGVMDKELINRFLGKIFKT